MMDDLWKDRSKEMKCNTCMYFVLKRPDFITKDDPPRKNGYIGRCRRHAPTMSGYPVVFELDWCGDHKLNKNAV